MAPALARSLGRPQQTVQTPGRRLRLRGPIKRYDGAVQYYRAGSSSVETRSTSPKQRGVSNDRHNCSYTERNRCFVHILTILSSTECFQQ